MMGRYLALAGHLRKLFYANAMMTHESATLLFDAFAGDDI